jgi:EAL domain-containing protein (putative c-di-GMP-specific phosphodiesterase class I)
VAIVTAIIQMARSLQLQVVAEGVEHPQQRALLHDLGCALAQGYGLSHPLDAEQIPSWWQSWKMQQKPV